MRHPARRWGDGALRTRQGRFHRSSGAARAGLMKSADQGMLFLDEIGELGLDEQAMCLRAIEEAFSARRGG